MKLNTVLRAHAILAASYAVGLILVPEMILGLLSSNQLNALGLDITRIFGAAIGMVSMLTWNASNLSDKSARHAIVMPVFIYVTLGAIIALMGQLAGNWGPLGWSNFGVYIVFSVAYLYFLFVKPE